MASKKAGRAKAPAGLPVIHRHAAGIDVGSTFHVVAVAKDRDSEPTRSFKSFTGDLHRLADWLQSLGITTIAMESTGIYWVPIFEILEERGFEVLLVNARDVKNVPGRKTDVHDAEWIQRLHEHGLLRGSFRPKQDVASLRAYLRHRERLVEYAASHVQHVQKALMQMNVQLHHVVSDITGVTGMKILRAVIAGDRDPVKLAELRDRRCSASLEEIQKALSGNYRPEHIFALRQAIELYDAYQKRIEECDEEIASAVSRLAKLSERSVEALPLPRRKAAQKNQPGFDIRSSLYDVLGTDLTSIDGLGPTSALALIGECGTDMSRWPTTKHFTSWLTLCPANKISGGRVLSSRTRKSSSRAAAILRMSAVSVGRTKSALGAFYRRLGARVGKAKAVTATARKLAILFYNAVRYGTRYEDPGADYYETQHRTRVLANLRKRAQSLGFALVAAPTV